MGAGSAIVNLASRAGNAPLPTAASYSSSKAALIMLTKCLAVGVCGPGHPGQRPVPRPILTEMNLRRYAREAKALGCTSEEVMDKAIATVPLGRIGTPHDVGQWRRSWLPKPRLLTGQALNVTGGPADGAVSDTHVYRGRDCLARADVGPDVTND
jgi:3-oxoacyl-[acyl-carrier protein] reductase